MWAPPSAPAQVSLFLSRRTFYLLMAKKNKSAKWYRCAHCDAGIEEQGCTCDRRADLDSDGYPTTATLRRIRKWPMEYPKELLEYVRELWHWPNYARKRGNRYTFITGGWSGNEDLISAMGQNLLFWSFAWRSSESGGRHVFEARNFSKETHGD